MSSLDGTLEEIDGQRVLRFERRLGHSIERVWAALTEPDELAGWLALAEIEPREGGRVVLTWQNPVTEEQAERYRIEGLEPGVERTARGTVTRVEPPRLLEYETDAHGMLRWELREDGTGCVLTLTSAAPPDDAIAAQALAGWQWHLELLGDLLGGRPVDWSDWPIERWAQLRDRYAATLAESEYKERQRQSWGAGDWASVAPTIQDAADVVVEELGVSAGHDVLDVGTGNGNAAIAAAGRGARVVGLDLVPELLAAARVRAAEAGVPVEWVEGDADELPFDDESFDRVMSIFGVIFAFDHPGSAAELVRVTRPGGFVGFTGWTPEGLNGQTFETVTAYVPAPPPEQNPLRWGDEDYVRGLFAGLGVKLRCERRTLDVVWSSSAAFVDHQAEKLGPMTGARTALEQEGRWAEARAALIDTYDRHNRSGDGSLMAPAEYLLTIVER
jgi:SAM-dependent methyltransferase/uncharacterized protein YndB with AHSA1/START domain